MSAARIQEALSVLRALGLPRAQQNERSALCLLALAGLTPEKPWTDASNPLIGITPIMDWVRTHYGKDYAPNTRETFRRQTMHQFVQAGLAIYNPDKPGRPVNSPKAVYQIPLEGLALLRTFNTAGWSSALEAYQRTRGSLASKYAAARELELVSVSLQDGSEVKLSPGVHSTLIQQIIQEFAPRFAPGSVLVYAGDTGSKWGYSDMPLLERLGVVLDSHGKMPDVVLHCGQRNWLLLVEAVTSHGPVDAKRHAELAHLFRASRAPLVYVTAFPDRSVLARYIADISWETEVWVADHPTHLIHFNGIRFLGPYEPRA